MRYEEIKNQEQLEEWVRTRTDAFFHGNLFYIEIKPGFAQHTEAILNRLEKNNIVPVVENEFTRSRAFNRKFYQNLLDRPEIWEKCNQYMCGKLNHPYIRGLKLHAPTYGFIVIGDIATARKLQGSTGNPAPGTIRHDFGLRDKDDIIRPHMTANVMHCSDSAINGIKEAYLSCYATQKKSNRLGITPHLTGLADINTEMRVEDTVIYLYEKITKKEREFEIENMVETNKKEDKGPRKINGGDRSLDKKHRGKAAQKVVESKIKADEGATK